MCYYSTFAHRARFQGFTRADLITHLRASEENQNKFIQIENAIIEQRRGGSIDLDMSKIPKPIISVSSKRKARFEVEAPTERVVTEAAFKRRTISREYPEGMSFKQAGMLHLVDWHENADGVLVQGFVETVGEADTFMRKKKLEVSASKKTMIDSGEHSFDDSQADDNFGHLAKKQKPGSSKSQSVGTSEIDKIIEMALQKKKDDDKQKVATGAPDGGVDQDDAGEKAGSGGDDEQDEEEDAEAAQDLDV